MSLKYHIIRVDCNNHDICIIKTVNTYQEAAEHLNVYLDTNFEINAYLKVYYNDQCSVSVFKYFYLFPKEMVCKLHIVEYEDIDD
jgi:hypothetical protein